MSRTCWHRGVWLSAGKLSGYGSTALGDISQTASAGIDRCPTTNGTWTKSSSQSAARSIGCGVLSTQVATYSTFSCKLGEMQKLQIQRLTAQFGEPRVVITDKLRSYIQPVSKLAPNADHRAHKGLNNAIEVSHRPTRKREKIFGRFKSHRQAQRFLSAHDQISLIFRPRRYQLTATSYRHARTAAFSLWPDYTAEMTA